MKILDFLIFISHKLNIDRYTHLLYKLAIHSINKFKFILMFNFGIKVRSFSAMGQDTFIKENIFKNKSKGSFIDIGASDGISNNNTYIFEKYYNWRGFSIEPNPKLFKKLCNYRKSKNFKIGIDLDNQKKTFFLQGHNSQIVNKKNNINKKNIFIQAMTLNNFFKKNKINKIDLIDIDTEGNEYNILKKFDFKKYNVKCFLIERVSDKLNKLLTQNGYILVKKILLDYIYVNKDFSLNKIKYVKPPKRKF